MIYEIYKSPMLGGQGIHILKTRYLWFARIIAAWRSFWNYKYAFVIVDQDSKGFKRSIHSYRFGHKSY